MKKKKMSKKEFDDKVRVAMHKACLEMIGSDTDEVKVKGK